MIVMEPLRRNLNPLVAIVMSFLLYTSENENFQAALAKLVSLKIIWKLKICQYSDFGNGREGLIGLSVITILDFKEYSSFFQDTLPMSGLYMIIYKSTNKSLYNCKPIYVCER